MTPLSTKIPRGLACRPETVDDRDFLRRLFGTTRYDIQNSDLAPEQKQQLLNGQFLAQHRHYQTRFPNASYSIICKQDRQIGRIYVDSSENEIRLIDIALMPEVRVQGIGGQFIKNLQELSCEKSLPLRLRVEPDNPALRLYQRAGFKLIADEQINLHLEWNRNGEGSQ